MNDTQQVEATVEQAIDLGLRADEFEMIKGILGRTPNFTETAIYSVCLLYTSPSPRDRTRSRMPSSA